MYVSQYLCRLRRVVSTFTFVPTCAPSRALAGRTPVHRGGCREPPSDVWRCKWARRALPLPQEGATRVACAATFQTKNIRQTWPSSPLVSSALRSAWGGMRDAASQQCQNQAATCQWTLSMQTSLIIRQPTPRWTTVPRNRQAVRGGHHRSGTL